MGAGENNLPKLDTRQWAAALRGLKAKASLERLDFERVVERMHAQVQNRPSLKCLQTIAQIAQMFSP